MFCFGHVICSSDMADIQHRTSIPSSVVVFPVWYLTGRVCLIVWSQPPPPPPTRLQPLRWRQCEQVLSEALPFLPRDELVAFKG